MKYRVTIDRTTTKHSCISFCYSEAEKKNYRHFAGNILKSILSQYIWISNEISQKFVAICSDNGMAPNRWQAISWTTDDPIQLGIYASRGLSELILNLGRDNTG